MNNDKLREAVGKLTDVFFELWGSECYDQEEYNQVFERILAELTSLFPAPEPVDDKAMTEAIKQLAKLRYNSITVDVCAIDTVLAALRVAQQEVAELKAQLEIAGESLNEEHAAQLAEDKRDIEIDQIESGFRALKKEDEST